MPEAVGLEGAAVEAEDAPAAVPFEISPGDECEFIPLYSEEEDRYGASTILCPICMVCVFILD